MVESVVEECIEQVSNRFKLVLLASQRAHDLNTGASVASSFKGHKNTTVSLCEIASRQISTHEMFNLLTNRCREYMKKDTSDSYSINIDKLEKVLNFSNNQFNADQDDLNIKDYENKIDTEDSDEKSIRS
jgi:DNA-directed RNA polymerase subunit omega